METDTTDGATDAGQAVYSPLVLRLYDWYVLGLSCRGIWRCPARRLLQHYNEHVSHTHLDVGVGTGFFLDRATFPTERPELTLFDLNANSLQHTSRRLARYRPRVVQGDALEGNALPRSHFGSIGLNFLLHCLPDSGGGKWRLFDHLAPTLAPGGVVFGSTILGAPRPQGLLPRQLMGVYNRKGIFSNTKDDLQLLRRQLQKRFASVKLEQQGVVALFSARDAK